MNSTASKAIAQQRCYNHQIREAVARCPECRRFYCSECITEHGIRLICASCLKAMVTPTKAKRGTGKRAWRLMTISGGFMLAWVCFYLIGRMLLTMTDNLH